MEPKEFLKLAEQTYSPKEMEQVLAAVKFAVTAHQGQKRLSGEDYIRHPLSVAEILISWQLDLETTLAGILHDTLEDSETKLETIEKEFGKEVAFLVDGVTKITAARRGMRRIDSYLPQTSDNLSKLLIAICSDLRVILIKLADRLHNLRTMEYLPPDKQLKVAQETISVFAPLADRLGIGRLRVEMEDISFSYLEPKIYKELSHLMKKRLGSTHKHLEKVRRDIYKALKQDEIEFDFSYRVKSVYSLYKKLQRVESIDDVHDLLALRIIVKNKEDCYRTLGILHSLYQPILTKIKDYISVPKPNGYQSLHTTVLTPYEQIVEFQIRTQEMHDFAERGLAASFHYNEQKLTKNYRLRRAVALPRNLQWISELQEKVQQYMDDPDVSHIDLSVDLFKDRIFAYSPRGDIYDLPTGATALDFAFAVHSDVGHHAQGAKINAKMAKLFAPLNNGDIVEIIIAKNVKPNEGWLDHLHTEKARQKVRSFLSKKPT